MEVCGMITLIYGISIIVGGMIGFLVAKSQPSLIAGGLLGILLILSAHRIFYGLAYGIPLAYIATSLIIIFFTVKAVQAQKNNTSLGRPLGILTLSIIELITLMITQ